MIIWNQVSMKLTNITINYVLLSAPLYLVVYLILDHLLMRGIIAIEHSSDWYANKVAFGYAIHWMAGTVSLVGTISKWKSCKQVPLFMAISLVYCILVIVFSDQFWPAKGFMAMDVGFRFLVFFPALLLTVVILLFFARIIDKLINAFKERGLKTIHTPSPEL
jgi:hypothetical protein